MFIVCFGMSATWTNYGGNITATPHAIVEPKSLDDLRKIVEKARAEGRTVRGVGDGHSFSSVAVTDGYLVRTQSYGLPLPLMPLRPDVNSSNLVHVEAGMTIRNCINTLRKMIPPKGLHNMGSYTGQALIGAISTGTHGSGWKLGPLANAVRSVTMVAGDGRAYRIEPTNGISDPGGVPDDITLIQDDSVFDGVVVAMGSLGLVYSLVLDVRDDYALVERRQVTTWNTVRPILHTGHDMFTKFRHQEVLINPYETDGHHTAVITTRRERIPSDDLDVQANRENPWQVIANLLPWHAMNVIATLMKSDASTIPGFLDSGLRTLKGMFGSRYDAVLSLGIDAVDGYASEVAVPFESTADAVDIIIDEAKTYRSEAPSESVAWRYYLTSPFSLRFVAPSSQMMAPQYNRLTTMIEIPCVSFPGTGVTAESVRLLNRIHRRLITDVGARLHWGLEFDALTAQDISTMYPRYNEWLAIRERFDPDRVFENRWSSRVLFGGSGGVISGG